MTFLHRATRMQFRGAPHAGLHCCDTSAPVNIASRASCCSRLLIRSTPLTLGLLLPRDFCSFAMCRPLSLLLVLVAIPATTEAFVVPDVPVIWSTCPVTFSDCPQEKKVECFKNLTQIRKDCDWKGIQHIPCSCCPTCMKSHGESCGGAFGQNGECAGDFYCTENPDVRNGGVCDCYPGVVCLP